MGTEIAPRTLSEIREEMRELRRIGDPEHAHGRADDLLIEGLRRLALTLNAHPTLWVAEVEDLVDSFQQVPKRYA